MDERSESQLVTIAAAALRRVLVEQARARTSQGGADPRRPDVLALDAALIELSRANARPAQVAELRFFAGLSVEETACVLHASPRAVEADWRYARAWLNRELSRGGTA